MVDKLAFLAFFFMARHGPTMGFGDGAIIKSYVAGLIIMVNIWLIYGYYMVIIWLLYGYYMVIIWLLYGYYMVIIWLLYGYYMVIIWLLYG